MSPQHYEEVEHTADIALRVWGDDFESLLRYAALGLYDLMDVKRQKESNCQRQFSIEEGSAESILVDFLNELLFLAEAHQEYFTEFHFDENSRGIKVTCRGQRILSISRDIKAVTFHDLFVKKAEKGLETIITFDV